MAAYLKEHGAEVMNDQSNGQERSKEIIQQRTDRYMHANSNEQHKGDEWNTN